MLFLLIALLGFLKSFCEAQIPSGGSQHSVYNLLREDYPWICACNPTSKAALLETAPPNYTFDYSRQSQVPCLAASGTSNLFCDVSTNSAFPRLKSTGLFLMVSCVTLITSSLLIL